MIQAELRLNEAIRSPKQGTQSMCGALPWPAATILRELGYDKQAIADFIGDDTEVMGEHYSRDADLSKKLDSVVENYEAELEKRKNKSVYPD